MVPAADPAAARPRQDLAGFRRRARLLLAAALAQYMCGTAALIAAAVAMAAATGLAQPGRATCRSWRRT